MRVVQGPTQRAQQYVQSELERFQETLSRCVLQCQDDVKDKVSYGRQMSLPLGACDLLVSF